MNTEKPGMLTSEFLIVVISQGIAVVLVKFGLLDQASVAAANGYILAAVGGLVSIATAVTYIRSRQALKIKSIEYGLSTAPERPEEEEEAETPAQEEAEAMPVSMPLTQEAPVPVGEQL